MGLAGGWNTVQSTATAQAPPALGGLGLLSLGAGTLSLARQEREDSESSAAMMED
jgi:hypothetical protein